MNNNPKMKQNIPDDWIEEKIGDFAKVYDGTHMTPDYVDEGIPFYSVEHVTANDFTETKFIAKDIFDKENERVRLEKGDVLMTRIGDIGKAKYIDWDVEASFYVSLALLKIRKNVDSKFISYAINGLEGQKEIWAKSIHVAYPKKINLGDISKCVLKLPKNHKEQRRIVKVLETWDMAIEKIERTIVLKRELKKGLMQRLLTGELRLSGFSSEWKKCNLGDLYEITSSKRVFESQWTTQGVPFYRAREIVKLAKHGFVENELFISREMFDNYKTKYGAPKNNDLLITGVGTIGRLYRVRENDEFYFKDGNILWLKHKDGVSSEFIEQLFSTRNIQKQVIGSSPITTVATYTIDAAKKTKVFIPDFEEQVAIASVLMTFDEEISLLVRKRKRILDQKRYLLNNLVTGQIRTPENL